MAKDVLHKLVNYMEPAVFEVAFKKQNFIFDKIMELVYDSEMQIKLEAIKLVFRVCDSLSAETQERFCRL